MATAARLPIAAWRNELCVRTIRFVGIDLTGVDMRMQVRLRPNSPTVLFSLATVTTSSAEGLKLDGVVTTSGIPTSTVTMRINKTTMADAAKVPYSGEPDSDTPLSYAIQLGGTSVGATRVYGEFIALATVMDSEGGPVGSTSGYGSAGSGVLPWSTAQLTFSDDDITITIDGADLLAPLLAAGTASAAQAAGYAGQALTYRDTTLGYRDQAVAAANLAQAGLTTSNLYPTTSAGLAGTVEGKYFAVASAGDAYATLYQKVSGAAVLVNTIASRAALDRIGRFVPNGGAVDNSVAINAALNDPLCGGVYLPAGNIRIDKTILIPTGKFLRGAGRGVTVITRTNSDNDPDGRQAALIQSDNSQGVHVSDLTLVAPKTANKVTGVYMRTATHFVVEGVACYNTGYSFFAQEQSRYGIFRDIQSFNANVHFETTAASDILFENMLAGDGDGDNPLGCEAVWHTLFGSKRITFRHGRHTGKGVPFLVYADSGTGDAGFMDDILFDDCKSAQTTGALSVQIDRYFTDQSVGRVAFVNCAATKAIRSDGGAVGTIGAGNVTMTNCNFSNFDVDGMGVGVNATLKIRDTDFYMESAPGASGAFFGADGVVDMVGGSLRTPYTAMSPFIQSGPMRGKLSPSTVFDNGDLFAGLTNKGRSVSYVYPEQTQSGSFTRFGQGVTGQPDAQIVTVAGATYRARFQGRLRKNGADGNLYLSVGGASYTGLRSGKASLQQADGSLKVNYTGEVRVTDAPDGAVREAEMDVIFLGDGGQAVFGFGQEGATLLAGAEFSIERLS